MLIAKDIMEFADASNLLRALKAEDLELLLPFLDIVMVENGEVLYEPGDDVKHAYFPCGQTLLSFVVTLDDARAVETALIGREGALGGIVSQGRVPAYCRALVRSPGALLRIESLRLEDAKSKSLALRHFFARYADCLLAQIFQAVACNATHTIEQRTAKWLVMALDHSGGSQITLTQEQLAGMLGVGRSYVGRIMSGLRSSGIVETARGRLRVQKPEALKALACGCNNLVREHFDEVLAGVYPD